MRLPCFVLSLIGLIGSVAPTRADLLPPIIQPREVKVVIQLDEKAKGPAIVVPPGVVIQRPNRVPIRPAQPKAVPQQNGADEEEAAEFAPPTQPAGASMVAGLALAMALGLGGMWLVRRNNRSIRHLAVLLTIGGAMTAGAVVWGNGAPIPFPKAAPIPEGTTLTEIKAVLHVPNAGDAITIVLDKETLKALTNPPAPKK